MLSVRYIVLGCLLAYLACPGRTSAAEPSVSFQCASKAGPVCTILNMKLEDATQTFVLPDASQKTTLNVKAGSVGALTAEHCDALRTFEKITIGPLGLGALCVTPKVRQLSAENNHIRTLHTTGGEEHFRLEVLKLNDNKLASVESMRDFVALRELHLERNVLTTLDLTVFARMAQLEKLFLGSNRLVTVTDGPVELPKLNFFGLANNTLTGLNVRQWAMQSLARLELDSNNLTSVQGFAELTTLDTVTLAANNWECLQLEGMLAALQANVVNIADADRGCDGIRNTSICCTVESDASEQTLLDEMKNYTRLEERYEQATKELHEQMAAQTRLFDQAVEDVKQAMAAQKDRLAANTLEQAAKQQQTACKNEEPAKPEPNEGDADAPEPSDDAAAAEAKPEQQQPCESSNEACLCPKKELDDIKAELSVLLTTLQESNANVSAALTNQPLLHRAALLARHEFRTAVKRGEHRLQEVHTKLAMLRDYIEKKLSTVV